MQLREHSLELAPQLAKTSDGPSNRQARDGARERACLPLSLQSAPARADLAISKSHFCLLERIARVRNQVRCRSFGLFAPARLLLSVAAVPLRSLQQLRARLDARSVP